MQSTKLALGFILAAALSGAAAPTPAERRIAGVEEAIRRNPQRFQNYNDLALALARRARETGDPAWYDKASAALEQLFRIEPGNFEGEKVRVWLLLGRHEFRAARDAARELNRRMPDDLMVYGFLVDANAELGDYAEAEKAAQWMLDLRPGNIPGLTRAAGLRELFGDLEGAIDFLDKAYTRTPPQETEDRAWILTQLGHLQFQLGKLESSERLIGEALRLYPDYHYALAGLARVRTAQKRDADAVDLLRLRYRIAPHPENLFSLAEALDAAGARKEAKAAYREFERLARREMEGADNANRELIRYYAGSGRKPAEALRIARREISIRRDVHTLDAYAMALHANGKRAEARAVLREALAVGVKDPEMLARARTLETTRR